MPVLWNSGEWTWWQQKGKNIIYKYFNCTKSKSMKFLSLGQCIWIIIFKKECILEEQREHCIYFQLLVDKKPTLSQKLHLFEYWCSANHYCFFVLTSLNSSQFCQVKFRVDWYNSQLLLVVILTGIDFLCIVNFLSH